MKNYILIALGLLFSAQVIAQAGLKAGVVAPAFTATDNSGKKVDLKTLLKTHKSVVLFFYRGQWCPYCNKQMQHIQDSLQLLSGKGAYVIGVTPETEENIAKTVTKTKASYSIVQDKGYSIMKSYGVNYFMDDATVTKYKGYGLDMAKANGNPDNVLPVPATYVIGSDGKIAFAHFDKDYSKRASVKDILTAL
ncbi:peroxiredoxin-like family protein [Mucilaginibacter glaciei]|uniref:thioredoxin-dependent peroxiredoxin n=1 Tax=Mucilaginibacter glaciei TaxID=2772109 RepID=A0A926S2J3_9SPHI|nr:peroxiredoxin-like family protein [Mucilaginibacter glaciei]MBD1394208.1 AhpC/TSA family protein [Mucilaginibacter glaciei]